MKKTTLITIILIIASFLLGYGLSKQRQTISLKKVEEPIKIGAILPMTGPAAFWGEAVRNGMEMAIQNFADKKIFIKAIYEDSQAQPNQGITAYTKLKNLDQVDIMFSLSSRVSMPLAPLADQDKMPLIMTAVSAKGIAEKSQYVFRFYPDEAGYPNPILTKITKDKYSQIAIMYLNDDYGVSVFEVIKENLNNKGIKITAEEKFDLGQTDFRGQLTKIKSKEPTAIMFVDATPTELLNVLKQKQELKIEADFFEVNALLSIDSTRKQAGESANGSYAVAFPFSLNKTGQEFKLRYQELYKTDPFYGATFGYDMINLIASATKRQKLTSAELVQKIIALKTLETLNGKVEIKTNGEINPPMLPVKIINGSLIEWQE